MSEGLKKKIQESIDLLTEVVEKRGAYSQDYLQHAENVIENASKRAAQVTETLKKISGWLDEATKSPQLLEKLAELEHEQWIEWSKTVAPEIDVRYYMGRLKRWEKCWISYSKLTEEQKEHDRKWARKVLAVLGVDEKEKARA